MTRNQVEKRFAAASHSPSRTIVFGLVVVAFLTGAFFASNDRYSRVKDAMQSVLPAVSSVLGVVVGFYFGSQKR